MAKKIVIVDDHPIVRDGLRQMLEPQVDLVVCGEAAGATEAMDIVAAQQPDLVLVDVFLDGMNGIELTKLLCERDPAIRVLVLSMHDEGLYADRALRAGARGYVMKQEASRTILKAIETVLAGGIYTSATAVAGASARETGEREPPANADQIATRLTAREMSVFRAIGEGMDRNQIAKALKISNKTVETHRANIKYKLNVESAPELARQAKIWWDQHGCQER